MMKKTKNQKKTTSPAALRKAKGILNNQKGFSYVLTCMMILITVMVVFVTLQYAFVYHIAMEQKKETQLKLDGYVTQCAVKNYDAIKQGESWSAYIDRGVLVEGAYALLGFPRFITLEYREPTALEGKYEMLQPTIRALAGDSFGVYVQYEIIVPFEVFGRKIADITVPIEIISSFTEK